MSWDYEFDHRALKEFKKLARNTQQEILTWLDKRIPHQDDPRQFGKALTGPLAGLWRYRIGDYRLICSLEDNKMIVLILKVGHRREVYE